MANTYVRDAERYDLATDSWENLSPLPAPCGYGLFSQLKNSITYAGYKLTSIIVYLIPNNPYARYGNLGVNKNKIIFNWENNIYVFVSENLYKINSNFSSFRIINNPQEFPICGFMDAEF